MDTTYSEDFFIDIVINLCASDMFPESTMEQEDSEKLIAEFNLEYLTEKGVLNSIIYVCVCVYLPPPLSIKINKCYYILYLPTPPPLNLYNE